MPLNMPDEPLTPEQIEAENQKAVDRAMAILARTVQNPMEVAAENANLRSMIKGAHALLHVLVGRLDGDVFVKFEEHSNIDPSIELTVDRAPNGDVHIYHHRLSRAERRKRK